MYHFYLLVKEDVALYEPLLTGTFLRGRKHSTLEIEKNRIFRSEHVLVVISYGCSTKLIAKEHANIRIENKLRPQQRSAIFLFSIIQTFSGTCINHILIFLHDV